jgi:Protein of unknown function (DUF4229)
VKLFALYTGARVGLFLACYGVIWLIVGWFIEYDQLNALSTAIVALVISSLLAYRYLANLRDRFAVQVAERASRAQQAFEARRSAEDHDDEPPPSGTSSVAE